MLHCYDQKYNKKSDIVKYHYNYKNCFQTVLMYFKM